MEFLLSMLTFGESLVGFQRICHLFQQLATIYRIWAPLYQALQLRWHQSIGQRSAGKAGGAPVGLLVWDSHFNMLCNLVDGA